MSQAPAQLWRACSILGGRRLLTITAILSGVGRWQRVGSGEPFRIEEQYKGGKGRGEGGTSEMQGEGGGGGVQD